MSKTILSHCTIGELRRIAQEALDLLFFDFEVDVPDFAALDNLIESTRSKRTLLTTIETLSHSLTLVGMEVAS